MKLKIGTRLRSAVDPSAEVLIVRAEGVVKPLECAGIPMVTDVTTDLQSVESSTPLLLGKRYELVQDDPKIHIELLVTKAGSGPLSYDGVELKQSVVKALPTSD